MQTLGNIEHLKEEIEKSFSKKLEEFEKEKTEEFREEKECIQEQHTKKIRKAKENLKADERKVFRTTLAEEKLKAKKEFEQKREELINEVFKIAEKGSKKTLISNVYLDFIGKFLEGKQNPEIESSFKEHKKHFPGININPKMNGIIVKQDNQIFDFTYDTFIESRKLDLRHKISKVLFST